MHSIRALGPEDHAALVALWQAAGLPYKPEGRDGREAFLSQLALPQVRYFGAYDGAHLIGSALATHDGRKGWINRVAVHRDRRRCGLGSALIQACEQWLDRCGIGIFAGCRSITSGELQ